MLATTDITRLKALGFDPDALVNAVKAEAETVITIPDLLSREQASILSTNMRKDGFEEGKIAMREILVKDIKAKTGVAIESKELDPVLEALKTAWGKPAANGELEKSLQELQRKYTTDLTEKENIIKQKASELFRLQLRQDALRHLPEHTVIDKDHILTLFTAQHEVEQHEGSTLVKRNGQVLKDSLQNPLSLEVAVKEFALPFAKKDGKAGEDDTGGAGNPKTFTNPEEHYNYWVKKGENPMDHMDTLKMLPGKK